MANLDIRVCIRLNNQIYLPVKWKNEKMKKWKNEKLKMNAAGFS